MRIEERFYAAELCSFGNCKAGVNTGILEWRA